MDQAISSRGNIEFWQQKVADIYFVPPLQDIIDRLAEINRVKFNYEEEHKPASLGKIYLFDLLLKERPDLFDRFDEKTIKACIFVAMEKLGYHSHSRRKKCFWRDGV